MHIIKLGATASTNQYLKDMLLKKELDDFTVVVADHQTKGRGQIGNVWVSQAGKNLMISVLKYFEGLDASDGFYLNCICSLALYDVLQQLPVPQTKVKWPNDIMSGNQKICGILIENTLKGKEIKYSIMGIGLNVNQTKFNDLPKAASLKMVTGTDFGLEDLLQRILERLQFYFLSMENLGFSRIVKMYEAILFKKGVWSTFSYPDNSIFEGKIMGITESGRLRVKRKDGSTETFGFKEVQLLY